jgi:acyl-CoA synthetase (AMP-forming)/AMP-acid ligase II
VHPSLHARRTPHKVAYRMAASGEVVTYGELDAASNRVARLLRANGLVAGDHIAILMENHPRFFEVCWGAQRSGIIYTAISTRLTAEEAAYIIADSGSRLLVTSKAQRGVAADLVASTPAVKTRLMADGTIDGYDSYERIIEAYPARPIADQTAGRDMLYSSGTTGRPKGVLAPLPATPIDTPSPLAQLCGAQYGMDEHTVYLSPAPLYHAAPLRFGMAVMRLGGTVVVMEHFDALECLRSIERFRATHVQLVPTMFVRMLKLSAEERGRHDLSSLRCAIHAAAPCPIPTKERMIEWWGPIVSEYYAGTEGNGMTVIDSQSWLIHKGSVGTAVVGQLKICGPDGGELPVGEAGTIYFADGNPFEYHNDPQKTAESRNARGWSTLGDIGYIDGDGYLYLTDRKAHMIISGGVNIYPQECENLLVTHPQVVDAAVFGVPNEEFGEEVKAVVQPRDMREASKALEEELIAFCRAHLSPIKCPRSVDFEAELPRHPTGKLYKRLLRDRYWTGRANKLI